MCLCVTDIWWKFHVNSTFRNIFIEKNGDVFNTYNIYIYIYIYIYNIILYFSKKKRSYKIIKKIKKNYNLNDTKITVIKFQM